MDARVTISKETMDKNKLDNRSLRKLRLKKLRELDVEGKLSKATCRTDITKMLGFSGGYDRGYSWLSKVICEGTLTETFLGMNSRGRPEYEYHMKEAPQSKAKTTTIKVTPSVMSETRMSTDKSYVPKMVIKYKDLSIELDNIDYELVERIVDKLASK